MTPNGKDRKQNKGTDDKRQKCMKASETGKAATDAIHCDQTAGLFWARLDEPTAKLLIRAALYLDPAWVEEAIRDEREREAAFYQHEPGGSSNLNDPRMTEGWQWGRERAAG